MISSKHSRKEHELRAGLAEDLVDDAVDEAACLLVEIGLEIGRRHLQPEDAVLRLAVLHGRGQGFDSPQLHSRTAC